MVIICLCHATAMAGEALWRSISLGGIVCKEGDIFALVTAGGTEKEARFILKPSADSPQILHDLASEATPLREGSAYPASTVHCLIEGRLHRQEYVFEVTKVTPLHPVAASRASAKRGS